MINPMDLGAAGDGETDDAPAIQAAIDWARDTGKGVCIKPAPLRPNRARGFYRCGSSLVLYERSHIQGAGMHLTELRFTGDTDGFVLADTDNMQSFITVRDMTIRGHADVSDVSKETCGLRLTPMNWSTFENIWIQDFVDGIECDAMDTGWVLTKFRNVCICLTKHPNPMNGYPRNGITLRGGSKKVQGLDFEGVIYGQLMTAMEHYEADGKTAEFPIELRGRTRLWAASGIKVYVRDQGRWKRQKQNADYVLHCKGRILGLDAKNVGGAEFSVRFAEPLPRGTVKIVHNDPTMARCINVLRGTGNRFVGVFGGAETGIYLNSDSNLVEASYIQLCEIGVEITGLGDDSQVTIGEVSHSTVDQLISVNPVAARVRLMAPPHALAN